MNVDDEAMAPEEALVQEDASGTIDMPVARAPGDWLSSTDWWTALRLILLDVAVGVSWALLLAGAVLFITGVSQFIYVDF